MRVRKQTTTSKEFTRLTHDSVFDSRHHEIDYSTVYLLRPFRSLTSSAAAASPWIIAAVNDDYKHHLLLRHPLTLKHQLWNLPRNFNLSKHRPATIAAAHTTVSFDKLLIVPTPKSNATTDALRKSTMFALYDGGLLRACPPYTGGAEKSSPWIKLSRGGVADRFDDIVTHKGKIYAVDREGRLYLISNHKKSRKISLGKTLAFTTVSGGSRRMGWRKRLVVDEEELYLVVRGGVNWLNVFKLMKVGKGFRWSMVEKFGGSQVLFMAKDYCFFRRAVSGFPGKELKNCIVYSEGAFPQYGKDCWEFTQFTKHIGFVRKSEDDIAVYRLGGVPCELPKVNWSPPSWIFHASPLSASAAKFRARLLAESCSQSESEPEEDERLDINSKDQEAGNMNELKGSSSIDVKDEDMNDLKDSSSIDEKDGDLNDLKDTSSIDQKDGNMSDLKDPSSIDEKDGNMNNSKDLSIIDEKDGDTGDLKDSSSKVEKDGDEEMHSNFNGQDREHEGTESRSVSQDQEDREMHDLKDSNSKDKKNEDEKIHSNFNSQHKGRGVVESAFDNQDQEDGYMECDSNSEEKEDGHSNPNIEDSASLQDDVSLSLFEPESGTSDMVVASLSAAEEEVTRTLLSMNCANVAIEDETSRKTITQSVLSACTSSTAKSQKSDAATAKFEGFDIRSDLVPTLQKIWQKYGNIIENSIMRSGDIVARALESLATMVQILEDNSAESLSDSEANYLSSTMSDLRCICFKVYWLIPFVEKAVQLHKSKPLVDSLHHLRQLSSQVKERREILFGELSKLHLEESKLKEEMAKVSKMIPFSGEVRFDEPLGLGLT